MEYLSEFMKVAGGRFSVRRKDNTAAMQLFAGARATRPVSVHDLLYSGSPASLVGEQMWKRLLTCGATSIDVVSEVDPENRVDFRATRW